MLHYDQNTPVLFIVFNRPETKAQPARLYIAADGPRNRQDQLACDKVRTIVSAVDWDYDVKKLFREKNLGCRIASY